VFTICPPAIFTITVDPSLTTVAAIFAPLNALLYGFVGLLVGLGVEGIVKRKSGGGACSGRCEHCAKTFSYQLYHCGFGDCSYAYCDTCGMTSVLSLWSTKMPKTASDCPSQQEICAELEQYLEPCACGGLFRKGSSPRCPNCRNALSAEVASAYLEKNAPGTKKGWRWQRNWHQTYCIVVEGRQVNDNFRPR
jgi:hypothetical protein